MLIKSDNPDSTFRYERELCVYNDIYCNTLLNMLLVYTFTLCKQNEKYT